MPPRTLIKPTAGSVAALLLVTGAGLLAACGARTSRAVGGGTDVVAAQAAFPDKHLQYPVRTTDADWQPVAAALGRTGTLAGSVVYGIPLLRTDLDVTTEGVTLKPGMLLGGYAAFAQYHDGTMLMGDLVVTEDELPRVTDALQAAGIDQTALHKHLLQQSPPIWWAHLHAMGDPLKLARGLKSALNATAIPPASPPPATEPPVDLDTAGISRALGRKGTAEGGIYRFTIARHQSVDDGTHVLPAALGLTTGINFQPLGGDKAAVDGDFVMTAPEVQHVIRALRRGGIDIVELHNHSLDDRPRLFYLHFWAAADAVTLARALRPALDATAPAPAS
ncbi:hypothetical protein BIV25_20285 [Streptomyces sp. MUSC 14]|uniref:DUF1259 domain-containing protein n=1 Tax=Streptomyces sp. MUSC 14 TaxID=1354889 RepID=UPI0008F55BDB|nr:DUF1259 domain-containing protein [Streptomyces sp. MUSC 14]OIJ95482.1 hypothetical protein BIV25_20285 [Streptomyces sp. MUSC 14]